jgi:hypothetical protein
MLAAGKEEGHEASPGGREMARRSNPARRLADTDRVSPSTSSSSMEEDRGLSSEEEPDTESVGGHFLPIFAKMKNTEPDAEPVGGLVWARGLEPPPAQHTYVLLSPGHMSVH